MVFYDRKVSILPGAWIKSVTCLNLSCAPDKEARTWFTCPIHRESMQCFSYVGICPAALPFPLPKANLVLQLLMNK